MNARIQPSSEPESVAGPVPLLVFGNPDKAKGSIVFLVDEFGSAEACENHALFLSKEFHVCYARADVNTDANQLLLALENAALKRLTVVGMGNAANAAQQLFLLDPGLIRRLVLIDAIAAKPRSKKEKAIRMLETLIPFGLPIRGEKDTSDLRTAAHRLRCPALVLCTPSASSYVESQSRFLAQRMPNARFLALKSPLLTDSGSLSMETSKLVRDFMEVPAKRSQKPGKP